MRGWLSDHAVSFDESYSKAELLDPALTNHSLKRYKVNPGKEAYDSYSSLLLILDRTNCNAI